MSFNGSGLFQINSSGQPVVASTLIESAVFNAFTSDIATGLSTCLTKDGQTTVTANIPLGGFRITTLGFATATTDAARMDNANSCICEFRLTLTSGTPVTTSDVTAAETIYMTPYKGNRIALYNGTAWVMRTSAEMSIDVPDVTAPHDVFCYDNAGTPTLEVLAWSTDTARATALALQDGVYVKSGTTTRRYIGTFYSTIAGNGQVNDSLTQRFLWNYYNRVKKPMRRAESTDSWNYTTATVRQANGSASNQLTFVMGVSEDMVSAQIHAACLNTTGGIGVSVGVGLDSTSTFDNTNGFYYGGFASPASAYITLMAFWKGYPGVGLHYLSWNEWSAATGTTTWTGDGGNTTIEQHGIHGEILC